MGRQAPVPEVRVRGQHDRGRWRGSRRSAGSRIAEVAPRAAGYRSRAGPQRLARRVNAPFPHLQARRRKVLEPVASRARGQGTASAMYAARSSRAARRASGRGARPRRPAYRTSQVDAPTPSSVPATLVPSSKKTSTARPGEARGVAPRRREPAAIAGALRPAALAT